MRASWGLRRGVAFLDEWLSWQVGASDVPGLVMAVQHRDTLLCNRAYGLADVATQTPLTPDHIFCVASQSKMFTAVAIIQLAQAGRLGLSDRITTYLPWLAAHSDEKMRGVTVRQLLNHTAGLIRDGADNNFWQLQRPFPTRGEVHETVLHSQLLFENYARMKYSNLGYALLGEIIEVASGQTYDDYVQQAIIGPVGLAATSPVYQSQFHDRIATGYTAAVKGKRWSVPVAIPTAALSPVTGWHATTADMCRFMAAHFWGESLGLKPQWRQYLHAFRRGHWLPGEHRGTQYGAGFLHYPFGQRQVIGHGGSFVGHRTATYVDPAAQLVVCLMSNARDMPIMEVLQYIFGVITFFEQHANGPVPVDWRRFEARLASLMGEAYIVPMSDAIYAIRPQGWKVFGSVEKLAYRDPSTLEVVEAADMAALRETVSYTFNRQGVAQQVRYGGYDMWPSTDFEAQLQSYWPSDTGGCGPKNGRFEGGG